MQTVLDPNVYKLFDAISLIASLVSLILGILAIIVSYVFKKESDKVNKETSELLIEIRTESKNINQFFVSESKEQNKWFRDNAINGNSIKESNQEFVGHTPGLEIKGNIST